jgi:hypothetical protein
MATRNSADPRCSSPQRTIAFVAENPTPTPTARHRSLRPSELADDRPGSLGLRARQTCQNASQLRVLPPPGAWTVTSSDATARHPGLGAVRTFSTTSRAARFARRRAAPQAAPLTAAKPLTDRIHQACPFTPKASSCGAAAWSPTSAARITICRARPPCSRRGRLGRRARPPRRANTRSAPPLLLFNLMWSRFFVSVTSVSALQMLVVDITPGAWRRRRPRRRRPPHWHLPPPPPPRRHVGHVKPQQLQEIDTYRSTYSSKAAATIGGVSCMPAFCLASLRIIYYRCARITSGAVAR